MGRFIAECCVTLPHVSGRARDLHKAYSEWAEANREPVMTANAFGRKLTERGHAKRETRGSPIYEGLALATGAQE